MGTRRPSNSPPVVWVPNPRSMPRVDHGGRIEGEHQDQHQQQRKSTRDRPDARRPAATGEAPAGHHGTQAADHQEEQELHGVSGPGAGAPRPRAGGARWSRDRNRSAARGRPSPAARRATTAATLAPARATRIARASSAGAPASMLRALRSRSAAATRRRRPSPIRSRSRASRTGPAASATSANAAPSAARGTNEPAAERRRHRAGGRTLAGACRERRPQRRGDEPADGEGDDGDGARAGQPDRARRQLLRRSPEGDPDQVAGQHRAREACRQRERAGQGIDDVGGTGEGQERAQRREPGFPGRDGQRAAAATSAASRRRTGVTTWARPSGRGRFDARVGRGIEDPERRDRPVAQEGAPDDVGSC